MMVLSGNSLPSVTMVCPATIQLLPILAKIGNNCIVAGHTIVTEGSEFPDNTIIAGVPGKAVATRDCGDANLVNAKFYSAMAESYANGEDRLSKEKVDEVLSSIGQ